MRKHTMILLALLMAAACGPAWAQAKKPKPDQEKQPATDELLKAQEGQKLNPAQLLADMQNWPVKIIEVRHADIDRLRAVLTGIFQGDFKGDRTFRAMIVRAPADRMPAIEDAIRRLDQPPPAPSPLKNVELTAYLVVASEQAGSASNLPTELQPVIKQLRSTFSYQGYRLLDTLVLRTREDSAAEVSGVPPHTSEKPGAPPPVYNFRFKSARVTSDEKGRVIWLHEMRLGARVPIATTTVGGTGTNPVVNKQYQYMDTGIAADVDIREGQKVVVGKANIEGPDKALFLVVSAKIAD